MDSHDPQRERHAEKEVQSGVEEIYFPPRQIATEPPRSAKDVASTGDRALLGVRNASADASKIAASAD